jgi:hypothetical protein
MTGDFGDGKFENKIFFEAGGKREAGGDDKLTFFLWGLIAFICNNHDI